jgi:hypothetical protein
MAQPFKGPLDYIDVQTRIVEFRAKHPEGSLQQVSVDFKDFGGTSWVIYTAAAYRSPEDDRPGMGTAWEPVPGKSAFTRDSELQNAETAAWGRAMVAALAVDTKKGIASAEEVRNRQAETIKTPKAAPADWRSYIASAKNLEDLTALHARAVSGGYASPELMSALSARKEVLK